MNDNQYLVFTKEQGIMTGKGNSIIIIHANSDKNAIKWAKKYFKDGNSTIWKVIVSLVLIKKFNNNEVELLNLEIHHSDQKKIKVEL